jgi:hypothetical protein
MALRVERDEGRAAPPPTKADPIEHEIEMACRETTEPGAEAGRRSDDRRGVCSIRRRREERARPPQALDRRA